jgi:hypothetical protein
LVDAPSITLLKRSKPICRVPEMNYGSMPNDGGNLLLSQEEQKKFVQKEPQAKKWLKRFMMGDELINNIERWALWLEGVTPEDLSSAPETLKRIEAVKVHRLASNRPTTKSLAHFPSLFGEMRQPLGKYIALPRVSSENRHFIPIAILPKDIIAGDKVYTISNGGLFEFGILMSTMHMAWMRTTCGRMKSDYSYSSSIVYNNFPWPLAINDKQKQTIENTAQAVLDARAKHPNSSLATLYDPITMPPELVKAHQKLDAAVDAAYSKRKFSGDADRVAFLFELYQQIASPLESKKLAKKKPAK